GSFKLNPFTEQSSFYGSIYPGQQPALNGEQYYYGKTNFEASPLNRVSQTFAPGNDWVGTEGTGVGEHAVNIQYLTNTANDSVQIWTISN
ncbi:DUF6443 domain-containing protein, partial [Acinetobacter baumannii]